jgi:hypothetical protein
MYCEDHDDNIEARYMLPMADGSSPHRNASDAFGGDLEKFARTETARYSASISVGFEWLINTSILGSLYMQLFVSVSLSSKNF